MVWQSEIGRCIAGSLTSMLSIKSTFVCCLSCLRRLTGANNLVAYLRGIVAAIDMCIVLLCRVGFLCPTLPRSGRLPSSSCQRQPSPSWVSARSRQPCWSSALPAHSIQQHLTLKREATASSKPSATSCRRSLRFEPSIKLLRDIAIVLAAELAVCCRSHES